MVNQNDEKRDLKDAVAFFQHEATRMLEQMNSPKSPHPSSNAEIKKTNDNPEAVCRRQQWNLRTIGHNLIFQAARYALRVSRYDVWEFPYQDIPDDAKRRLRMYWDDIVLQRLKQRHTQRFSSKANPETDPCRCVRERIQAFRLCAELIEEIMTDDSGVWPPDGGWHFRPGKFAVARQSFSLSGMQLKLLEILAKARWSLSARDLKEYLWPGESRNDDTLRTHLSDLRKALCELLKLPHDVDLVKCNRQRPALWQLDKGALVEAAKKVANSV